VNITKPLSTVVLKKQYPFLHYKMFQLTKFSTYNSLGKKITSYITSVLATSSRLRSDELFAREMHWRLEDESNAFCCKSTGFGRSFACTINTASAQGAVAPQFVC